MTGPNARAPQNVRGGRTIPDHISTDKANNELEVVEAKFGPTARLSPRQREAYAGGVENYRVDHFLPQDIGATLGAVFGKAGGVIFPPGQKPSTAKPKTRRT